jgi:hypothetical protein
MQAGLRGAMLFFLVGFSAVAGAQSFGGKKPPVTPADPAPTAAQCGGQGLSQCTSQRIQELRRYREAMRRAATITGTGTMGVDEGRRVGMYDRWLNDVANQADQVALRGQASLQGQGPTSVAAKVTFNEQYLGFMQRLRTESRRHDTTAGLMKRKHAVMVNMLTGGQ